MTKRNRTARFFYASAFVLPFFWAAAGNTLPLFEAKQERDNSVVHVASTTAHFASLEKEVP